MARILCMHTGLTGILNASLELMSRLQALGHEVTCASPQAVGEQVKTYGFDYLQLPPVNYDLAPELPAFGGALRKLKRLFYKFRHMKSRRAEALTNLGMDQFLEQVKAFAPDLVVTDIELHEQIMTLVSHQYKVLLLSQWFSTWDGKGLPPIQSAAIPGQAFSGSAIGLWLSWRKVHLRRWYMFFKKKLTSGYNDRRTVLQAYARQVGFPLSYIRKNYWPGPFSYEVLPVISMTEEALEFPHQKREGLSYVGPMVYPERLKADLSPDLEAVFQHKKEENKSLIYCSVSTYSVGDVAFLKKVVEAVRGEANWLLIVSLGTRIDPSAFNDLPENAYLFDSVPQLRVLKEADLSINHGGIHTINECLFCQVPMLVYSGKTSDQNGCAARVHYHGLGLMADKDADDALTIRQKIIDCLKTKIQHEAFDGSRLEQQKQVLATAIDSALKQGNPMA